MIFLGGTFLNGDSMSVPLSPTYFDNINKVTLQNGKFDDLYITNATSYQLSPYITEGWNLDTILWAKFDGNTSAGNVNWTLDTVKYLLVKRKKKGDFKWITLKAQKLESVDDFNMKDVDFTAQPNYDYEYAVVPIINNVEGFYNIAECNVNLKNSLMIADYNNVYVTNITNAYLNTTSQVPPSVYNTMNNQYATFVKNTDADYVQINVEAEFIPIEDCKPVDDAAYNYIYRQDIMKFLRRNNLKVLKSSDSRMWLAMVSSSVTDSVNSNSLKIRTVSFDMTEAGAIDDEKTLYDGSFISAGKQWWNNTLSLEV